MVPLSAATSTSIKPLAIIAGVPIEAIVLVIFAVIIIVDALRSGTRRATVFSLSVPISLFIYSALLNAAFLGPYVAKLTLPMAQPGLIAAIFVLTFIILYKLVPPSFTPGSTPIRALLAGLAATVILALFLVQPPTLITLWDPSSMVKTIFGAQYRLYWLLGAFIALAVARR